MSPETRQNALLIGALLAVGAGAWLFQLRAPLVVDATPLSEIPSELASWKGQDIPLEQAVERMLRADYHVQRAYLDPAGGLVWLYVGYYGTDRGGRSEHAPSVCYPASGWEIKDTRSGVVDVPGGGRVNEIQVERAGERRLVHFWYRSHRSSHLVSGLGQAWDRFVGRVAQGRADGAFVRISAPLGQSEEAVRSRLFSFGRALDAELATHWPNERPRDDSSESGVAHPEAG